jgi:hypothetical protein
VFIKDLQLGRALNAKSATNNRPLFDLAKTFITQHCNVSIEDPNYCVKMVVNAAVAFTADKSVKEQISEFCDENLGGRKSERILQLIDQYAFSIRQARGQENELVSGLSSSHVPMAQVSLGQEDQTEPSTDACTSCNKL